MSLLSSARKATTLSPPLPPTNRLLAGAGILLRQGQFSLVAAAPGVGKSVLATNLAIRTGVPTLFFSADSDEWTVRTRACSILTGQKLSQVEQQLNLEDDSWAQYYADNLVHSDHVDWCYRTDIDLEFIITRMNAYGAVRGDFPKLIVVDNLGNTVVDQDNEYAELRGTCRELQAIARTTKAHVMGLHHVKGAKENGTQMVGQGDLLGNLSKIPELVLGLSRAGDNMLCVNVAKNRGGKAQVSLNVPIDYTTATVGGFQ